VLMSSVSLEKHMRIIHKKTNGSEYNDDIQSFICGYCCKVYFKNWELVRHIGNVHERKENNEEETDVENDEKSEAKINKELIECKICSAKYPSKNKYVNHYKRQHGSIPPEYNEKDFYFCEECPQVLMSSVSLEKHMRIIHKKIEGTEYDNDIENFICGYCCKVYFKKWELVRHIEKVHERREKNEDETDVENDEKSDAKVNKELIECKKCSAKYPSKNKYVNHYKRQHGSIPPEYHGEDFYFCEECSQVLMSLEGLEKHKRIVHQKIEGLGRRKTPYKSRYIPYNRYKEDIHCEFCPLVFTEKKTYATHLSEVHGEIKPAINEIQCKSCEMKFAFPNYYIQHHQNEHGSLPPDYIDKELFFCDKCPQVSMMIVL